jgi:hypothetical protein
MPYEGEILDACPADLDFANSEAVVVSGASWNPCGHMVLCTGTSSTNSWYFHVAGQGVRELYGVYAYPKFMRGDEAFNRYLRENKKHEIRRLDAAITDPSGAYTKLMQLMAAKWFWEVLPHNCASFVKEVISAGGGNLAVMLNCPDQEVVHKIEGAIRDALEREAEFQRQNPGPKW